MRSISMSKCCDTKFRSSNGSSDQFGAAMVDDAAYDGREVFGMSKVCSKQLLNVSRERP
ncbi:hypothetical protein L195_g055367 [Trifolium pratense]|uniref:Uncharacterized protein n=1 Tax=Trifolium pratense TaxID=57577 RepID=A0A2K3KKX8_TRIPR|nr:hypothetical protein L195_g055367 [Trifolium pratense]